MLPSTPSLLPNTPARHYFPTFDSLRLLAFFKTYLAHLQVGSLPVLDQLRRGSGLGVSFFFVLSGFLITYLACGEKQAMGRLNLRRFFKRRALRIWPLYYVIVLFGLALPLVLEWLHKPASLEGYSPVWWVSLLFLDNYKTMWEGQAPSVSMLCVLWSLCIEEHFYLVWGLLIYVVPVRAMHWVILSGIGVALLSRFMYQHAGIIFNDLQTHLDLFAWGSVPALALVRWPAQAAAASRRVPTAAGWAYLGFAAAVAWKLVPLASGIWYTTCIGITFSGVLFLLLAPERPWQVASSNILVRAGMYTYGLYMWHEPAQGIVLRLWHWAGGALTEPLPVAIFMFLTLSLCFVLAWLSYQFIERPFLRLRPLAPSPTVTANY